MDLLKSTFIPIFLFMLSSVFIYGQSKSISGIVSDADGNGLPGVNIIIEGTSTGIQSDLDGSYNLNAAPGDIIAFTFLGMQSQRITVGADNVYNIILQEDSEKLDEVVITAFGLQREKKSITYAAQTVESDQMQSARPLNVTSGLSGKVAGLSVTQGANGVGSNTRVLLRGNRSITGNSQPLYVVDGVPLGGDISSISPDDIKSISVLRGPNAAALYGNRANNGAIVITTKSGNGAEGTTVSVNTSYMSSSPLIMWDFQNEYGQGIDGIYSSLSTTSWGPKMTGQSVEHWSNNPDFGEQNYSLSPQPNNVRDFYQTGHNLGTNVSVANSRGNGQTYFSYTYNDAVGVVPNNTLQRHNLNLRASQKIFDKLTLDSKVNYIRSNFRNEVYGGENFANPNRHALRLPRNIRSADASQFEFMAADGTIDQHYWKPLDNGGANPYWTVEKNNNNRVDERVIGFLSLKYDLTDNLNVLLRSSLDRGSFFRQDQWHNDSYVISQLGIYRTQSELATEWNSDALLNYNDDFGDFSLDLNVGANLRRLNLQGNRINTGTNTGLNVENVFALSNIKAPELSESFFEKEVQSVYTFGQLGYRDFLFLDASFRNDWSSTLPKENLSFNYPSFGLTAIISDMVTLPSFISFAKVRANYAKVGNDTDPYRLSRELRLLPGGTQGIFNPSNTLPESNLLPEETRSTELGLDVRFMDSRFGVNLTLYKSNSINQLFNTPLPVASGAASKFQNGGDIENKGIEMVVNLIPIEQKDFSWDVAFNFSRNISEVVKISEGFDQVNIPAGPPFWGNIVAKVGSPYGEFFSRGFERDDKGNVIVDANGVPMVTSGATVSVGNFNPDWLGGMFNEFRYKNINLSFLIDIRQGGIVSAFTEAVLAGDGLLESTVAGREGGVFGKDIYPDINAVTEDGSTNNIQTTSQAVFSAIGGRNAPTGEAFVKDASNARMREIVLGYSIPNSLTKRLNISNAEVSLVGRNLFFLYNRAGQFDPEVFPTTGSGYSGFNSFSTPTSRNIGVNLKLSF